jgi:hypothetical protein
MREGNRLALPGGNYAREFIRGRVLWRPKGGCLESRNRIPPLISWAERGAEGNRSQECAKRIASGDGPFGAALEFAILPRKMAAKRSMEGCGRGRRGCVNADANVRAARDGSWFDQPLDKHGRLRFVAWEASSSLSLRRLSQMSLNPDRTSRWFVAYFTRVWPLQKEQWIVTEIASGFSDSHLNDY